MQEHPATAIDQPPEAASPDRTDRFRVIRQLGAGGAAEVFLAVTRGPGGFRKLVVLKKPRTSPGDAALPRNMFFHEARIAARLNHPNCAQVIGIEEIDGVPTIVLEYLEGLTLSALRSEARGQVPLAVEVSVLHDALLGLQHAHELRDFDGTPLGVVHRDVSPQNLLVTYDGEVKVLDFGIAKANRQTEQTEVGIIKGKFRYMPPEQVNGSPIDARTDVFAAGIILWEALTKRRLWPGSSPAKLLQLVTQGNVPSPRTFAPDVPELLEKVCLRATAKSSQDRYRSAQEMAIELANAARELRLPAGRELLADYLDAHFREVRRAVRAQVESELAEATFQEADKQASEPWEASSSHVSIPPELSDSFLGSTVPAEQAPGAPLEEAPLAEAANESASRSLVVGGLLGFLACVVALLAWNRYATGPMQPLAVPSVSKSAVSTEREQSALVAQRTASSPMPGDQATPQPVAEAADSGVSPDAELAPRIQEPSSTSPHQPASAARPTRKPASAGLSSSKPHLAPEAPSAAAAPPPPPPNCKIPFELTPDGLKRFKPECLVR